MVSGDEKLVKGGGGDKVGGDKEEEEEVVVIVVADLEKLGGETGFKSDKSRNIFVNIGLSSLEDFGVSSSVLFC